MLPSSMIIDGAKYADDMKKSLKKEVTNLIEASGKIPKVVVLFVGDRQDSAVYVRQKQKMAEFLGVDSQTVKLPEDATEARVLEEIDTLNNDPSVNGILIQHPLPKHINETKILERVSVRKDVDGFNPINQGYLTMKGKRLGFGPCTPLACVEIIDTFYREQHDLAQQELDKLEEEFKAGSIPEDVMNEKISKLKVLLSFWELEGKNAVIIGRSNTVGVPLSMLLLQQRNMSVSIVHSKSKNIKEIVKQGDIVIAACGSPQLVKADWIKETAVVVDVGINAIQETLANGKTKTKLVGDVCFDEVKPHCVAITPVPGGVGPVTINMLFRNVISAFREQNALLADENEKL